MKNFWFLAPILMLVGPCMKENKYEGILSHEQQYGMSIKTLEDVYKVYPKTPQEIEKHCHDNLRQAKAILKTLRNRTAADCTKEELLGKIDALYRLVGAESRTYLNHLKLFELCHPVQSMRDASHKANQELSDYCIEYVSSNLELYRLTKAVFDACIDSCTAEEKYLFECLLRDFKKMGLEQGEEGRTKVIKLRKEINELSALLAQNDSIAIDRIILSREDLEGLSEENLQECKLEDGMYEILSDAAGYNLINSCSNQSTKEKFWSEHKTSIARRKIPLINKLIDLRTQLAITAGYPNYAHYDLDGQAMETPEKAWAFLEAIAEKASESAQKETELLKKYLPEGVSLSENGKIKASDLERIREHFRKECYGISAQTLAEYFPKDKVLAGIIEIYEQLFDLCITKVDPGITWHPDVELLQVTDKNGHLLGYVYLDLYTRPDKLFKGGIFNGVYATKNDAWQNPAVITLEYFLSPTKPGEPNLLSHLEVLYLFHEFGHIFHSMFGVTQYGMQSGCLQTQRDFIEFPARMLENFMYEKDIVKRLSSHYKTGEQLPGALLDKYLEMQRLTMGDYVCTSLVNYMYYLNIFDQQEVDIVALYNTHKQQLMGYCEQPVKSMDCCQFLSLYILMYGPTMYTYLWSLVGGVDLFEQIKKEGLLDPAAGKRYVDCILSKGASVDGNTLMKDYLGRETTYDAFYKKMGF